MLKSWFANPHHRFHIFHPAVNELFEKLDEELLIGEKPELLENWWGGTGISDTTIIYGSGDYIGF